ncbi:MAG: L-serine ammonia-lyase, iron-sulfur-dependent, subunit alpha [Clostridiales bacterium]|nr:L-serine ammonia-lyase, iron-sulfur-dependent, subunit alpha [Clostridiales bacterium]
MFNTGKELLELTKQFNCNISDILIKKEFEVFELSEEEVLNKTRVIYEIMKTSAQSAISNPDLYKGHIIGGDAKKMSIYASKGNSYCGETLNLAMARAFSTSEVNASMGLICAAPTAGASGILPAAIITGSEKIDADENSILRALLTSAAIGELITKNATVSGAEGGCQAETGTAAAMAAAALVELKGGTPEEALNASSIALKNVLGLVCDPIAGLVESPCAKRNAAGVANAMVSADMSLAGVKSIIPFDEMVETMLRVGRSLPFALKETALGGIAITPTAKKLEKKIFLKE